MIIGVDVGWMRTQRCPRGRAIYVCDARARVGSHRACQVRVAPAAMVWSIERGKALAMVWEVSSEAD